MNHFDTKTLKVGDTAYIEIPNRYGNRLLKRGVIRVTASGQVLTSDSRRFDNKGEEMGGGYSTYTKPFLTTELRYQNHKAAQILRDAEQNLRSELKLAADLPLNEIGAKLVVLQALTADLQRMAG